jgi:hypothetical protein
VLQGGQLGTTTKRSVFPLPACGERVRERESDRTRGGGSELRQCCRAGLLLAAGAIVENLEVWVVEHLLAQLEQMLKGRKEGVAFDDTLHEGEV